MNENRLSPLPQYHIDRDKLCEIVKETVGYDRLMDAFCNGTVVCDEFAWFSNADEYYIIHLDSGMMVNWYKHLGRTNTARRKIEPLMIITSSSDYSKKNWTISRGECNND